MDLAEIKRTALLNQLEAVYSQLQNYSIYASHLKKKLGIDIFVKIDYTRILLRKYKRLEKKLFTEKC